MEFNLDFVLERDLLLDIALSLNLFLDLFFSMKSFNFTLLILLSFPTISFSQFDEKAFEKKMEMKTQTENYSWFYKNFFLDYKLGAASEFFYVPTKKYEYLLGYYNGDETMEPHTYVDAGFMMSIFNFTLEPRINIYGKQSFSIYLKAPITFGLSILGEREESNILKGAGVFNFNLPIMIGFAKGLNSTFTNASKRGIAVSAGYQFMKMPLVGGKAYAILNDADKSVPVGEPYVLRKNWVMPLVQIDYYKLSRKNKIRGYSLALCPYGNFYIKLAMNFAGTKK